MGSDSALWPKARKLNLRCERHHKICLFTPWLHRLWVYTVAQSKESYFCMKNSAESDLASDPKSSNLTPLSGVRRSMARGTLARSRWSECAVWICLLTMIDGIVQYVSGPVLYLTLLFENILQNIFLFLVEWFIARLVFVTKKFKNGHSEE
jgi:hypothetical protein